VTAAIEHEIGKIARPANVWIVPDMPKTRSGKIMRRVIADISNFTDVGDVSTLANPEIVDDIRHRIQAQKLARGQVPPRTHTQRGRRDQSLRAHRITANIKPGVGTTQIVVRTPHDVAIPRCHLRRRVHPGLVSATLPVRHSDGVAKRVIGRQHGHRVSVLAGRQITGQQPRLDTTIHASNGLPRRPSRGRSPTRARESQRRTTRRTSRPRRRILHPPSTQAAISSKATADSASTTSIISEDRPTTQHRHSPRSSSPPTQ
jgi:hypothetical protein